MPHSPLHFDDYGNLPEAVLVERSCDGCQASFAELARRYSGRIYHFLRFRARGEQDAEDLTQETLLRAFQNKASYDRQRSFSTWLFTIAYRLMINYYQKQSNRRSGGELPEEIDTRQPDTLLAASEESNNLWALARKLKQDYFTVLWLRYAEEMPVQEIARVMHKSQIHVRVLLHRARGELKIRFATQSLSQETAEPAAPARSASLDLS